VLRGLHYQLVNPQGKLVRAARGEVYDVAVDIRRDSPYFGQWFGTRLDDVTHRLLWIPPGFAHGFCVLSDEADFAYKCTQYYDAASDAGVRWDDPAVGIDWPELDVAPQLSDKDRRHPCLAERPPQSLPSYDPSL
jgi:dTDP-4-dehydrorhamnose 3,5-epimerase